MSDSSDARDETDGPSPPTAPSASRHVGDLWRVAVVHLLIRAAAARSGVIFDHRPLAFFWQYLDPEWLTEAPLASVARLHVQPPLFNLLIAATGANEMLLGWLILAAGLCVPLCIYALVRRWGGGRRSAGAAAVCWSLMPASILYEHWLFYTIPVTALLVGTVLAVSRFAEVPTPKRLALLGVIVCTLCWTRSAFHLLWAAPLLLWVVRGKGRVHYLVAAVTIALIMAPYLNNLSRFGFFGTSSWMGMSLAKVALPQDEPEALEALAAETEACRIAVTPPFSPIAQYGRQALDVPPESSAVLSSIRQPNGHVNMNHFGYIDVSRRYRACALHAIREHPEIYAQNVYKSAALFLQPPSGYWFVGRNADAMRRYVDAWSALAPPPIALLIVLLVGVAAAVRFRPRGDASLPIAALTVGYYFAVTSMLEIGENHRFAVVVWPVLLALLATAGSYGVRRWRERGLDVPSVESPSAEAEDTLEPST